MANAKPSSDLAVTHTSADLAALDQLDTILLTGVMAGEVVEDPEQAQREIIAQLLAADSDAGLQQFGNAEPWGDYLEVPMELRGFTWRRSDFEGEGSPVYFIVRATDLTAGAERVLTTGSMSVLAQLSNMARRGTLVGGVWQLHEAEKPTRAGYKPRWLVQPEQVREAAAAGARQPADAAA